MGNSQAARWKANYNKNVKKSLQEWKDNRMFADGQAVEYRYKHEYNYGDANGVWLPAKVRDATDKIGMYNIEVDWKYLPEWIEDLWSDSQKKAKKPPLPGYRKEAHELSIRKPILEYKKLTGSDDLEIDVGTQIRTRIKGSSTPDDEVYGVVVHIYTNSPRRQNSETIYHVKFVNDTEWRLKRSEIDEVSVCSEKLSAVYNHGFYAGDHIEVNTPLSDYTKLNPGLHQYKRKACKKPVRAVFRGPVPNGENHVYVQYYDPDHVADMLKGNYTGAEKHWETKYEMVPAEWITKNGFFPCHSFDELKKMRPKPDDLILLRDNSMYWEEQGQDRLETKHWSYLRAEYKMRSERIPFHKDLQKKFPIEGILKTIYPLSRV